MIKCEKCLYRKNCQFLATHKKTTVEGCTAFASESDLKAEAVKEFAERVKDFMNDVPMHSEEDFIYVDYFELRDKIDNLVKEMVGDAK